MGDRALVRAGLIGAAPKAVCWRHPGRGGLAPGALGLAGAAVWVDQLIIPGLLGLVVLTP